MGGRLFVDLLFDDFKLCGRQIVRAGLKMYVNNLAVGNLALVLVVFGDPRAEKIIVINNHGGVRAGVAAANTGLFSAAKTACCARISNKVNTMSRHRNIVSEGNGDSAFPVTIGIAFYPARLSCGQNFFFPKRRC